MNGIDNVPRLLRLLLLLILAAPALQAQTMGFVENRGQWQGPGRYLARYTGLDLWVTDDALLYDFHRNEGNGRRGHVIRMRLDATGLSGDASDARAAATAGTSLGGRRSYLGGARQLDVAAFAEVAIRRLAPGVDLVVYDDGGRPRYDLHLAAGVDAAGLALRFDAADAVSRAADGTLRLATSLGEVEQRELLAYQMVGGERRTVTCAFEVRHDGAVGFRLGEYDRSLPLVIDPLTFSTFIGGANDDAANAVAIDSAGNVYLAGETASPDFPYVTGSYFASLRGVTDAFVSKLSPDGRQLIYSTYLGGSGDDAALDIAVDSRGHAYVVGRTSSRDFPVRNGYDSTYNGAFDAFVVKLDTVGRSLVHASLIGGSSEDVATSIAVGPAGHVYVAGYTQSSSFPTTPGAYQTVATNREGFLMKLAANGSTLLYSTFVGGGGDDEVVDLAVRADVAYVAGSTNSDGATVAGFPTSTGAAQGSYGGGTRDGFVVAVDTNGRSAIFATLLGGNDADEIRGIAVDGPGSVYVTGGTYSTTFPTTGGVVQATLSGVADAFVAKIGPLGTTLDFATLVGGAGVEAGEAISVTGEGRALVTGSTTSTNFPVVTGALQSTSAGGRDLFVAELSPLGSAYIYSSYLGGTGNDSVLAMAHVGELSLYLAGTTSSTDFPATVGAYRTFNSGGFDAFVSRFDIVQLTFPNGRNVLCAGDSHLITWTGSSAVNYDLALSANNGLTWSPIALSVPGNSFLWGAPTGLAAGTAYRIRVSVSGGSELDASDTSFTILAPVRVVTHPASLTRAEGSTVTFTASAAGSAPIGVTWQRSTDGGATWTDIPGANADQLAVGAITADQDSTQYRALYTNQCDTVTTRAATLIVQAIRVLSPSGGETFCQGTTQQITFTRQHVGAVNIELSTNGGVNWDVIQSNVDADSYAWTIPMTLRPGTGYQIRVSHTTGQASDIAVGTFSVYSAAQIVTDPQSVTAQAGSIASFTASGDGFPGYTIQWQTRATAGSPWTDIPGADVGTLLLSGVTATQNGSEYRAIVTNACGSDTSAAATLTVDATNGIAGETGAELGLAVRPNPARDEASISYTTRAPATARLDLVDARGAVVRTLVDGAVDAGEHVVRIDTRTIAAGQYRVVLVVDGVRSSVGVTVVR